MREPTGVIYNSDARDLLAFVGGPIHLVVTSPPYGTIKQYLDDEREIGSGQNYVDYIDDTISVLRDCASLLVPGGRMCVNVGEQYLSTQDHGRYRVAPIPQDLVHGLHGEIDDYDVDYMGTIIWNKVPNQNASGGGKWMGTTYWPTDIGLTFEHEYILVFRKQGTREKPDEEEVIESKLTKEDRGEWSRAMWRVTPEHKSDHPAPFPIEIPTRLIKLFSFYGDTVLDPFLGGGTTMDASLAHGRSCIGVELSPEFAEMARIRVSNRMFYPEVKVETP